MWSLIDIYGRRENGRMKTVHVGKKEEEEEKKVGKRTWRARLSEKNSANQALTQVRLFREISGR